MRAGTARLRRAHLRQFARYCAVGVLNTAVTFAVIYLCSAVAGLNEYLSNILGYFAGLVNSFVFNKLWTFRSHGGYRGEAVRFAVGFGVCYLLQLWAVWMLTGSALGSLTFCVHGIVFTGYAVATLIGNIVYTLANFIYNKLVTFR